MGKGSIWMAREGVGAVWGAGCLFQVVNSGIQSAPTPPWPPILSPSCLSRACCWIVRHHWPGKSARGAAAVSTPPSRLAEQE